MSTQRLPARRACKRPLRPAHSTAADTSAAVDAFMATLVHPHKAGVEALRQLLLALDPSVQEGVKWNAPSFRTTDYFATVQWRARHGVGFGLVLHRGAKVRPLPAGGLQVDDPAGLLTWLAPDRAVAEFADTAAFTRAKADFGAVLRQWLRCV
jgi:hypothetical protein